jgi:hypothetical protein
VTNPNTNANKNTKQTTMSNIEVQTAKFIPVSDIVPESWKDWFFSAISENAPFSWGDNNRTLVDALDFRHHVENVLDIHSEEETIEEHYQSFMDILTYISQDRIYIDLEN